MSVDEWRYLITEWERRELRETARSLSRDPEAAREIRALIIQRMRSYEQSVRAQIAANDVRREARTAIAPMRRALKLALRMRSVMPPPRRAQMTRLAKEAYAGIARLEQHLI